MAQNVAVGPNTGAQGDMEAFSLRSTSCGVLAQESGFPGLWAGRLSCGLGVPPAGEFIIGRVIKAMNNSWHPECFRCDLCQEVLADISLNQERREGTGRGTVVPSKAAGGVRGRSGAAGVAVLQVMHVQSHLWQATCGGHSGIHLHLAQLPERSLAT